MTDHNFALFRKSVLYRCVICGAAIFGEDYEAHDDWHMQQNELIKNIAHVLTTLNERTSE